MNGTAKWVRVSWMAGALLPLVGVVSAANLNPPAPQTNQPLQRDQVATSPEQTAQFQPKLEKAKDLIGAKVVNDKGERLGTVADIVLMPSHDAINYVVLTPGGTWGTGDKYFAVPWSQFGFQSGEKNEKLLVLTGVSKADIDRAPGFDKSNWPATASANWLGIERGSSMAPSGSTMGAPHEGTAVAPQSRAYTEPVPGQPPAGRRDAEGLEPVRGMGDTGHSAAQASDIQHLRLSKLFGTTVRNLQNEDLGKLDNAMIDVHQGKVAYGIVAIRRGFLGLNKDYVPVPWSALDLTREAGIARLDVDKDTLMALAFARDNFPNLEDPQYSRQLFERFHATPYWESPALGFIPGQEAESGNLPPDRMTPPDSGMVAPNVGNSNVGNSNVDKTAPNSMTPNQIGHKEKHEGKQALSYNPDSVQTIHGTVSKVATHRIRGTSDEEVRLTIKTDDGKTMLVNVGPRFFVDRQNITFHPGDPVTITGSLVKMGRHDVIVASQIQTADRTLSLRTPEGNPLWSRGQARIPSASGRTYGQYQNSY